MNNTVTAVVCSDHAVILSIFISALLICMSVVIVVSVGGRGVRPWQLTVGNQLADPVPILL